MGEWRVGSEGASPVEGDPRRSGVSSVRPSVSEALDTDLDAYLDRELFARTTVPGLKPVAVPVPGASEAPVPEPARKSEALAHTPELLTLAQEEETWLRNQPPPAPAEPPRVEPVAPSAPVAPQWSAPPVVQPVPAPPPVVVAPPAPSRVAPQPVQPMPPVPAVPAQQWGAVPVAPSRSQPMVWLVAGVLAAVLAVGVFVAGLLWASRMHGQEVAVAPRVAPAAPAVAVPPPVEAAAASTGTPVVAPPVEATGTPVVAPPARVTAPAPTEAQGAPAASRAQVAPPPEAASPRAEATPPPAQPRPSPVPSQPAEFVPRPASDLQVVVPARALAATKKQVRVADSAAFEALRASTERLVDEETPSRASSAPTANIEPVKDSGYEDFDAEYAKELGFTDKKVTPRPDPRSERSVWIPPAPGEELPERLTSEVIMRVVVSHKPAITACIQEHKARTQPTSGGRFVARWNLQPDGSTVGVTVETAEFRGTPLARCMENLIRSWQFPRHRVQQEEPVRFPFTF